MSGKSKESQTSKNAESFFIKIPDAPQINSSDAEKAEQNLLAQLKSKGPRAETLKPLAVFYSRVAQQERAYQYLKLWMKHAKNKEELAECLLISGQLAEQVGQPEPAIAFYREALEQKSEDRRTQYYLHNNLAYCLNLQGEYAAAQDQCQLAIQLDPSRANAFKNLGISLSGQGKHGEAARAWIKASYVDVSDTRAFELLEKLVPEHREEILQELPDIQEKMDACRKAGQAAKTGRFADWARGLTLN